LLASLFDGSLLAPIDDVDADVGKPGNSEEGVFTRPAANAAANTLVVRGCCGVEKVAAAVVVAAAAAAGDCGA